MVEDGLLELEHMIKITYLGQSSFKIKSTNAALITDPFDSKATGLPWRKQEADIVTISHEHSDHNCLDKIDGNPFVIREPGEYEIKGVHIIGESSSHGQTDGKDLGENTFFTFRWDDFVIVHLGDLGKPLASAQLEELGQVDVLMVPVGGKWTIGAEAASELIAQIEPCFVVPMHYRLVEEQKDLQPVTEFLDQMGAENITSQSSLDLKSKNALPDQTQVVLLDYK